MAHPDESQRALADVPSAAPRVRDTRVVPLALLFVAACAATLLAYLALAVPGPWFPSASEHFWTARDLQLTRGTGTVSGEEWTLQSADSNAFFILSGNADLRSSDYRAINWIAVGVPATADVRFLWRNDYEPGKLQSARVIVESGRLRPVELSDDPAWIGRIKGIALAVRGPVVEPIRIRGAIARPMGALDVLRDRAREWFALEGWTGTSINTIVGGADVQDFPLTFAMALAVLIAAATFAALHWRERLRPAVLLPAVVVFIVLGWFVLDARWSVALARQSIETGKVYGGKDSDGRHLVAEDADLYRMVMRAKQAMPAEPQRVFVAAGAHYFRGRAAYHLYPHNVYFDPRADRLPPAATMHSGDWLFVYQRSGIQYDRDQKMLRWEGGQTHPAELAFLGQGGALFRLL